VHIVLVKPDPAAKKNDLAGNTFVHSGKMGART
jgi:hypothetical protein